MSSVIKNIIIYSGILLTIIVGYYFFTLNNSSDVSSGDAAVQAKVELETKEFLDRLIEVQSLDLKIETVKDERLQGLVDYYSAVPEVPAGRVNPFAVVN